MRFQLIDAVESRDASAITAVKVVTRAEEYLADHFPTYPVLPGVLMIETLVQAARELLRDRSPGRLVLGEVKALRYGRFVRPGEALRVRVELLRQEGEAFWCKGAGVVVGVGGGESAEQAVAGRFCLRPIRGAERMGIRRG